MALNIPNTELPGNSFLKGLDTGSNMFSRMINPVIQRENMMRQWKQHLDSLALQKQQMAHAERNDDLHRKILAERLTGLHNSNDEFNRFKSMYDNPNGPDMEAIKNNPALRGLFKKHFGIDPGAENKPNSSLGKVLSDLKQAKAMGAPDEQIKQLERYAQRLSEGNQGVNLSVDPSTGAINFTSGGQGYNGNQQQVVNGQVISKPTTAVVTDQQKLQLAAVAREQALEHVQQPYLGAGASFNMASDLAKYATTKDPNTKKQLGDKLVKAAVSEKIVPEIANLQITSQGGKATVHALEKQEQAIRQGWPTFGKKLAGNLPKELQDRVVAEHNQRLKDISDIRKKYFVKGLPVDLNETNMPSQESSAIEGSLVPMISPHGKKVMIPADKVKDALAAGGKHA